MVQRFRIIFLLLFLIFGVRTYSQSWEESSLQTSFDHADGLLNTAYTNLFKASDGTIWANSDRGLAWFDNYRWHSYKSFQGQSNIFNFGPMDELPSGEIVTTYNDTLYLFSKKGWKKRVYFFKGKKLAVFSAAVDGDDLILKVNTGVPDHSWMVRISGRQLKIIHDNAKSEAGFFSNAMKTRNGGVLMVIKNKVYYYKNKKNRFLFRLPFSEVAPLRMDVLKNGDGYIGFSSTPRDYHIVRFNLRKENKFSIQNLPYYLFPRWCEFLNNGDILVLNRGGNIFELAKQGKITQVGQNWSAGSRNFIIETNPGEIWMGSFGKLYRIRFQSPFWAYQKFDYANQFNHVNALFQDKEKNTWIGIDLGLIRKAPDGSLTYFLRVGKDSIRELTSIAQDDQGKIWVGSGSRHKSTFCFDGKNWRRMDASNGFTNHSVHKIIKGLDGSLYFLLFSNKGIIMGSGEGIIQLKNGKFSSPPIAKVVGNQRVYDLIQAPDSTIFVAGNEFLFNYKVQSGQVSRLASNQNFGKIYDLATNDSGEIFLYSTPYGIGKLEKDSILFLGNFQERDSRKSVAEIHFDHNGILWHTGAEGINAWFNGYNYQLDQRVGLKTQASWPIISVHNQLVIGTSGEGLQYINDSLLKIPLPEVEFKNIISDDVSRGIAWSGITWNHEYPNDYSIQYQVNDEAWSNWTSDHQILLPGLKSGKNTIKFRIKGLVPHLLLDKELYQTSLYIPYPIFLQPVFLIPFTVLLIIILAIIVRTNKVSRNFIKNLQESERKINSFVRSMPFNSAIIDESGTCIESYFPYQSNKNAFRINEGENIAKSFTTENKQEFTEALKKCIGSGSYEILEFNENSNQEESRYFELRLSPFLESGKTRAIAIFIDITESQKNRQELLHAKQIAEKASQAKMQFLSNMSHEIRTPMNAIIGITDLLLEDNLDNTLRDNLEIIRKSADHLLVIINDILDLSKVEAGKIQIDQTPFAVRPLINQFSDILKIRAAQKGLTFTREIHPDIPEQVIGDPVRLNQILVNLMGNAIKFTREGEVKIEVLPQRKEGNTIWLIFKISDTGIGISKENQDKIFEIFDQENLQISRQYGGTGLGLSISRQLTQLMGGLIELESEKGHGSVFTVTLPFGITDLPSLPQNKARQMPEGNLNGKRLLIVEDNRMNQLVLGRILTKWNCEYAISENGLEALEKLKTEKFDLVLMDLQMPIMDGLECTRLIRSDLKLTGLPIIALTADAFPEVQAETFAAGMNDFVSKPFKQEELYSKIVNLVKPF